MTAPRFTLADLANTPAGKLPENQHLFVDTNKMIKKPVKKPKTVSLEKTWMQQELEKWTERRCLKLKPEHRFHAERKWRFDWCIPALMIAIEYEGLMSAKSRHTTVKGFSGDTEKYNAAAALGWKVYRYTALTYHNLLVDLKSL
jgi:hypothetical protein